MDDQKKVPFDQNSQPDSSFFWGFGRPGASLNKEANLCPRINISVDREVLFG